MKQSSEFRRNWVVLLCCSIGAIVGPNVFAVYTAGMFYLPLSGEFGWTRTELSLAQTILPMVFALTSPFVGYLIDRHGERWPIVASLLFQALWLAAMATLDGDIFYYWFYVSMIGLMGGGATTLTFSRIVSTHFVQNRGFALGIALSGTGVLALFGPGLVGAVIAEWGWRAGYVAMALTAVVATPLIVLPIWRRIGPPASRDGASDAPMSAADGGPGALVAAIKQPVFWMLIVAFPAIGFAGTGLIVHLVPFLIDGGVTSSDAAQLAGLIGLFMIVARVVVGILVDRMFAPKLSAAMMLFCAFGFVLTGLYGVQFAWVGALCIGLSIGAEFDLTAYMIARYFPVAAFGRIYGLIYGCIVFACAISPVYFGYIYDLTGDYRGAIFTGAGMFLVATIALMCMPAYPVRQEPKEAATA